MIRDGVIGTGMMGWEHLRNLAIIPDAVVTAEEQTIAIDPAIRAAGFHHGATYYQHLAFHDAIRRGAPPQVSGRDGALAVAVGLAGELSAREHRPVELRELGF